MGRYSPEESEILSHYVSNLDGNIYSIFNLPEEVIAVVFARVSRTPHSFRDNLLKLIRDRQLAVADNASPGAGRHFDLEKARQFHERVVIGYGHSSVAELAVAHVGVERISRLASARLELANPFVSFIEYSQRYQRPARGDYYTPPELEQHPNLLREYHHAQGVAYDCFEQLVKGLVLHLRTVLPRAENETEKAWSSRVEKVAFEDARYALTLAVHTNLGLTANGRALRDAIVRLLSDQYPECNTLAADIRLEVSAVLPVLLRYAQPSSYLMESRQALEAALASHRKYGPGGVGPVPSRVVLVEYAGQGAANPERVALRQIIEGVFALNTQLRSEEFREAVNALDDAEMVKLHRELVCRLGTHDNPMDPMHRVHYGAEFEISEACWHQLLRHCRKVEFAPGEPDVGGGWVVPPNIATAGLTEVLARSLSICEQLYSELQERLPLVAPYVVTNAHRRRVLARFDLWELHHLVHLRGSLDAQWEIRRAILALNAQVKKVHANLVPVPRRSEQEGLSAGA